VSPYVFSFIFYFKKKLPHVKLTMCHVEEAMWCGNNSATCHY